MGKISKEIYEHIKTHSERATDDRNAVVVIQNLFRLGGKINEKFSHGDKWPNIDGDFELISNPIISRAPDQRFVVQIKGTGKCDIKEDGSIKYQLKSLAFPAYIANEVTSDPGILFVVFNVGSRNNERVFWKYMSPTFISEIDFENNSTTITFTPNEEIKNTDESVDEFADRMVNIAETHSFVSKLSNKEFSVDDLSKIVQTRCKNIDEAIETGKFLNHSRDNISRKIFTELKDLCASALRLNGNTKYGLANLKVSWEYALLKGETRFLASFLKGLQYIDIKVPEDGQYERLMLKYYDFLWRIRKFLKDSYGIYVLKNLELFPREINEEDEEYNKIIATAINSSNMPSPIMGTNKYYIQRKTAFYVGTERYFEYTLQLANKFATKYNRITAYSKIDISTSYSIQVALSEINVNLWDDISNEIIIIGDWRVSIEPRVLNKLAKALGYSTKISSSYSEYRELMRFLTSSGINLLDFIDFDRKSFNDKLDEIYTNTRTDQYKEILIELNNNYSNKDIGYGKYTIRYIIQYLREDLIEDILPFNRGDSLNKISAYLSKKCHPFELHPVLYNLPGHKVNADSFSTDITRVVGSKNIRRYIPYLQLKALTKKTGEIYFDKSQIGADEGGNILESYNNSLNSWDKNSMMSIKEENNLLCIDEYETNTLSILNYLNESQKEKDMGQEYLNERFLDSIKNEDIDGVKRIALSKVFVGSNIFMIYGAAGTGKTTLIDYISKLMQDRKKLFLTKTHTALENLQRRITSPGSNATFSGIDSIVRRKVSISYDVVFIDECSTIDNRTMSDFLKLLDKDTLLVLAGDIYQIESIEFGNWFFYAKNIINNNSIIELTSTWRTQEKELISLWEEVRYKQPLITEKLVIDGPFSENIGKNIFDKKDVDEVVLCLNYDGKFGLNNINNYFQNANKSSNVFKWRGWSYKIGDPILFNDNQRFPSLYNNLKGTIIDVESDENQITFTVEVKLNLIGRDSETNDFEIVKSEKTYTHVKFSVYTFSENQDDEFDDENIIKTVVPFQLAYAVSIHKAQGLEYNSVKVVIPNSNSENITHGIFYTAITRAKEKLKIYWSSDTMDKVIKGFTENEPMNRSLEVIKGKYLK